MAASKLRPPEQSLAAQRRGEIPQIRRRRTSCRDYHVFFRRSSASVRLWLKTAHVFTIREPMSAQAGSKILALPIRVAVRRWQLCCLTAKGISEKRCTSNLGICCCLYSAALGRQAMSVKRRLEKLAPKYNNKATHASASQSPKTIALASKTLLALTLADCTTVLTDRTNFTQFRSRRVTRSIDIAALSASSIAVTF